MENVTSNKLEEHYQFYLNKCALDESLMPLELRKLLKDTYMGACGQMVVHFGTLALDGDMKKFDAARDEMIDQMREYMKIRLQ